MKRGKATDYVLGVTVTNRTVHAVLLGPGADGERELLRSFSRQRGMQGGAAGFPGAGFPGADGGFGEENGAGDFTIQFGEGGSGASELFLGSEFGGVEASGQNTETTSAAVDDFELELGDILAECRDAGYEQPLVALCMGSVDVAHVELVIPDEDRDAKKARKAGKKDKKAEADDDKKAEDRPAAARHAALPDRTRLLAFLGEQYSGEINEERVAFLPMTPSEEGRSRVLAILAKPGDVYVSTLKALRSRQGQRPPTVRLLDTEVSLYLGVARAALARQTRIQDEDGAQAATLIEDDAPTSTLLVRVGVEDTLVMFLQGEKLHHYESLRSLTAYDAPETVCSRVLLQQDEHGIGDVHHVLLLSQEREADLIASFEIFFPGAEVNSLREALPKGAQSQSGEPTSGGAVPAIAAALRLHAPGDFLEGFDEVNLLPKGLARRRLTLPHAFSWQNAALLVILFCTVFFFMWRYFSLQSEISDVRERIEQRDPALAEANARKLQLRIDSLKQANDRYVRALGVVDSLLVGSDRWSRGLEKLARETAAVQGIWVEQWSPRNASIELAGNATSRDRVVYLAERMKGEIRDLSFSEIREWPVYTFTMRVPLPSRLPEAAKYFREQVVIAQREGALDGPSTGEAASSAEGDLETPPVSSASLQE